jgi:hypothetical protein
LQGSKDEEKLLQSAVKWQYRARRTSERLGGKTEAYLKNNKPRFEKNTQIVDAWEGLLPEGLSEHCDISEVSGGTLKIEVDPGVYMHELKLISGELIEHLRQVCPRCGIRKIKLQARSSSADRDS